MTAALPEFLDLQAALAGEYSLERELGADVNRLADAQRQAERIAPSARIGARPVATPA